MSVTDVPRMWGTMSGNSKFKPGGRGPAQTLLPPRVRVGMSGNKGVGLGRAPASGPPAPLPRHRITRLHAAGREPRATVPPSHPDVGRRVSALRPQARPCGPLAPPSPQAHALDPAGFCQPPSVPPTHLHRREHKAPARAPKLILLAACLPSFIPSFIHSNHGILGWTQSWPWGFSKEQGSHRGCPWELMVYQQSIPTLLLVAV